MTHKDLMALADAYAYAALNVKDTAGRSMNARAALSDALKQMCDDLDAFDKAENSFMRKAIELEAEVERLKKQVIRAANFELDLLRALDGQVTLCGFDEIAEVEKLKADNADLRRDEALNEAEDLIRQALQALLPHKSTALRWYTPVDATIDAINRYLND